MEQQKQPKIVQKMLLRTFFLLLAVAAVFLGINFVLNWRKDPDTGTSDTVGMVAAIEILPEGQQAVLFDSSGKKTPSPDYEKGKTDRDIAWRPDGNRLFFTSDRKEAAYHLYRWNPGTGSVDPKSTGSLSKFDPSFPTVADPSDKVAVDAAGKEALLTQGGVVLAFNILESSAHQVLPPPGGVTVGSEEGDGNSGQFDGLYKKFGNAFRSARWLKDQEFIAGIMKRDEGEILIIQKLVGQDVKDLTPRALMAGDKIDIDVDPKTGSVIFTVLNFQFPDITNIPPESIKDGKVIRPFVNCIFAYDPASNNVVRIALSNDEKQAFGPAVVSPDGSQIAVTTGSYDGTTYVPAGLALMPVQDGGMNVGTPLVKGQIYEISWSPNGETLTFIQKDGKERAIYKVNKDGSGLAKISDGGNYMTPKFSPQVK
jgi:dipeptidyl aminopeptidase/acylaminoacyl peptidase